MLKSTDGGINWDPANDGLGSLFLLTMVLDEENPGTLYAATAGEGVYLSEDAGASWRPLNAGLFNPTVTALDIQHLDNTIIYAGTEGGGLFKLVR